MLLYSLLHLTGYADMTLDELKKFRQLGARTAATPSTAMPAASRRPPARWVRASAIRWASPSPSASSQKRFGRDVVDHYTYVIAGDGA